MAIYLDTGRIEDVERFMRMGIIRGVTTNPTILLKAGVTGGKEAIKARSIEIAKLVAPYPLSVEVTTNEPKAMLEQARELPAGRKTSS
jgi:transaldolase